MISVSLKKLRKKLKVFLDSNENENMTYQNLWDAAKAMLRGKFIAMSAYIRVSEISNEQPSDTPQALKKTKITQALNH
jgi:hypothetical protein